MSWPVPGLCPPRPTRSAPSAPGTDKQNLNALHHRLATTGKITELVNRSDEATTERRRITLQRRPRVNRCNLQASASRRNRLTRFHVSRCRNTENAVSIQSWELHSIRIDAICPHTRHASLSAGSRMIIGARDSSMPDIDGERAEQHYYQRDPQLCGT